MLRNLQAEMVRSNLNVIDLCQAIKKSERTTREKISGKSAFDFSEALTIRDTYFPGLRLEYLFFDDNIGAEVT